MSNWRKKERKDRAKKRKAQKRINWSNDWRERHARAQYLALKAAMESPIPEHERLCHRLADPRTPKILTCVLSKRLQRHSKEASYGWCDAFIDVLQDFKADTDAAIAARSVVDELGIPIDLLHDRAALRAWLFSQAQWRLFV